MVNYIQQMKKETDVLLLDSQMLVRGKNVLIVLSSLLRMTIYTSTVSVRKMETSSADSTFAQHVDAE